MTTSNWTRLALTALVLITANYRGQAQTVSILYKFGTDSGDPTNPSYEGTIAQGRDGTLYSTAPSGGSQSWGAVFQISPGGTLSVPYSFDRTTGSAPQGGLTLGRDGNFSVLRRVGAHRKWARFLKFHGGGVRAAQFQWGE